MFLRKLFCEVIARCCRPRRRPYSTYVVFKLAAGPIPTAGGRVLRSAASGGELRSTASDRALRPEDALGKVWIELKKEHRGIRVHPFFDADSRPRIDDFVKRVVEHSKGKYRDPGFFAYGRIVGPRETDFAAIANKLLATGVAVEAYVERPATPPAVNPIGQPLYDAQFHLKPAPKGTMLGGIDAPAAWAENGGDGQQMNFVDVERGWLLDHDDLPAYPAPVPPVTVPLHGENDGEVREHGTAVLGILCAKDATGGPQGGVGIAPHAVGYVSSWFEGYDETTGEQLTNYPRAIIDATTHLANLRGWAPGQPVLGDVIVIEAQIEDPDNALHQIPLETNALNFHAIELATQAGLTVVEAGGNGDYGGWYFDSDAAGPLADSLAILVSAADWQGGVISPFGWAPRGSRINCFAWGFGIHTCWADYTGATDLYAPGSGVDPFGGTSAATAIVAGAAIALQGIARQTVGGALTPNQMRAALSARQWNTNPAQDSATGQPYAIGCMPDLGQLVPQLKAGVLHQLAP
jgi:hypothetical protein